MAERLKEHLDQLEARLQSQWLKVPGWDGSGESKTKWHFNAIIWKLGTVVGAKSSMAQPNPAELACLCIFEGPKCLFRKMWLDVSGLHAHIPKKLDGLSSSWSFGGGGDPKCQREPSHFEASRPCGVELCSGSSATS